MQEFLGGSGIYVHPDHYRRLLTELRAKLKAGAKPPAAWLASDLLSMFYNFTNFSPPCTDPIDQRVIDSIISEYPTYVCAIL